MTKGFGFAAVHDAAHRSGKRVLSYCFMPNPIHLLLEIVPASPKGISDAELPRRPRAINSEAQVAEDGAKILRGGRTPAAGVLWSARYLRVGMAVFWQ